MRAKPAVFLFSLAVIAACTDHSRTPTGFNLSASRNGQPFAEELASPEWQVMGAARAVGAALSPQATAHALSLLGVAQYWAVQRADGALGNNGRSQHETERGAVAGASAVVMTYLFPTAAQNFEDLVTEQSNGGPGQPHPSFARGEAIGRTVGAEIVARAQTDGFGVPFSGTIPTGPGLWISNTNPATIAAGQLPTSLPWFLTSQNQFRPVAPPAFGSAAFNTALTEIRQISDTRTAEQTLQAALWAPRGAGFWLQVATDNINSHGLSEPEATHLYALASATIYDALIGCWDGKQAYWYIRPWQVDPAITTTAAVGKPNHPSYPSGHSCASASAAEVISTYFPEQRTQLEGFVVDAGLSRMYGGIHYRFDIDAGQTLGRNVAQFAIAADASGNSVLTAH
jgi:membrane-associated phospholipid phosphatase